jgi:hypothetical protein
MQISIETGLQEHADNPEKTKLTPAKVTEWNGAKNNQRQEDVEKSLQHLSSRHEEEERLNK